jgi:hypothetical protein
VDTLESHVGLAVIGAGEEVKVPRPHAERK